MRIEGANDGVHERIKKCCVFLEFFSIFIRQKLMKGCELKLYIITKNLTIKDQDFEGKIKKIKRPLK